MAKESTELTEYKTKVRTMVYSFEKSPKPRWILQKFFDRNGISQYIFDSVFALLEMGVSSGIPTANMVNGVVKATKPEYVQKTYSCSLILNFETLAMSDDHAERIKDGVADHVRRFLSQLENTEFVEVVDN